MEVMYTSTNNANLYREILSEWIYATVFQYFVCLFIYNMGESNLTVQRKASIPGFLKVYTPTISHNCHR